MRRQPTYSECGAGVRPVYHPDKAGDRDSAQIFPKLETHEHKCQDISQAQPRL